MSEQPNVSPGSEGASGSAGAEAGEGTDYDAALADAAHHVADTVQARREAGLLQRPRSKAPLLVVSLAALALVVAWNIYLATRAPEPLSPAAAEGNLRYEIGVLVEEIEAYRSDVGALPSPAELEGLLDEVVTYRLDGERYTVSGDDGEVRVVYDGSVPLEEWMREGMGGS